MRFIKAPRNLDADLMWFVWVQKLFTNLVRKHLDNGQLGS